MPFKNDTEIRNTRAGVAGRGDHDFREAAEAGPYHQQCGEDRLEEEAVTGEETVQSGKAVAEEEAIIDTGLAF